MTIDEVVNELLIKIPYSKKYQQVRIKIKEALETEYNNSIKKGKNNLEAITEILKHYGTLTNVGALAGFSKEEIKSWKETENITSYKTFKQTFKKEKRTGIILSISFVFFLIYLFTSLIFSSIFNVLFSLIPLTISLIYLNKYRENLKIQENYSFETYFKIQNLEDKYHKKTINSILFGISVFSLSVIILGNTPYRYDEIISILMSNITFFEIIFICIIKNILINKNLKEKITSEHESEYQKQLKTVIKFTILYWIIGLIIAFFLYQKLKITLMLILGTIFFIFYLFYILILRKKIVYKNIEINKKRIGIVTLIISGICLYQIMKLDSWLLSSNATFVEAVDIEKSKIEYNNQTGVYTLTTEKEDFKILQLTDIHLGGSNFSYSKDSYALYDIKELIKYTKPDLVIVTGDLVFPVGIMSMSFNNKTPLIIFASFMRNLGVPWAFTYGNHDTESMATLTEKDVDDLFKMLSFNTSKNFLYPYIQPDITGRNNQIIEIRNKNGKLLQDLFLLDSNSYIEGQIKDYDYIHEDQVQLYEENVKKLSQKEGYTIPSMLFFHIPLQEYQIAYNLYKNNSQEVTYHFGKIGEKNEAICASKKSSKLFDKAVELGSTKAMFCGHDHLNNLSLTYKGIRLTYGLSIDYLAYPGIQKKTEQRGGTLITINENSEFTIEPIKAQGLNLKNVLPNNELGFIIEE